MEGERLTQGIESGSGKVESEKKFETITDFIDSTRTVSPEYQTEIKRQKRKYTHHQSFERPYSPVWEAMLMTGKGVFNSLENTINFLKKHLSDSNLIDLGAGKSNVMELLCERLEVRTYIKVDAFYLAQPKELSEANISFAEVGGEKLHIIKARSDMLNFVALMRDNSGNFVLNGINPQIIKEQEYATALANELVRATRSGGIIFGASSEMIENALRKITHQEDSSLTGLDLGQKIGADEEYFFPDSSFVFIKK